MRPKWARPGPSLQPSAGSLILGSCTTSHPHSRLPDHASNVLLPINKQIRSAVINFVSNGPVVGCVCFCGDQQHATHPSPAKLYTCLMITHIYDEKDDLDMSNVFFNEPVPLSRWGRRRIINPFAPSTANMSTEVATTPSDPSPAGTTLPYRSLSLRGFRG